MRENVEALAKQTMVSGQGNLKPTIELVSSRRIEELNGVCLPGCAPSCPPNIFKPPCRPDVGLPRPPRPKPY